MQFDPVELKMGIEDEMEHTDDRKVAEQIARDHLEKDPRYYTKLKQSGLARFSAAELGEMAPRGNELPIVRATVEYVEMPEFVLIRNLPSQTHRMLVSTMGNLASDIHDDAVSFPYNKAPDALQFLKTMGVNVQVTKRSHASAYTLKDGTKVETEVKSHGNGSFKIQARTENGNDVGYVIFSEIEEDVLTSKGKNSYREALDLYGIEAAPIWTCVGARADTPKLGLGMSLYLEAFKTINKTSNVAIIIPHEYVVDGSTSYEAKKLWRKLKERFDNAGDVLIIDKRAYATADNKTHDALRFLQTMGMDIRVYAGEHKGVMICFYPPRDVAEQFAVEGGEAVENMHVTLAYLGKIDDLPDDFLERTKKACEEAVKGQSTISGEIGGIGRWAAGDDGDVVYASVDLPGSNEFRNKLSECLQSAGVPAKNNHGWTAHMTIQYLDGHDPDVKISHVDPVAVSFDSIWIVVGDEERHEVKFSKAKTAQAVGISFDDFEWKNDESNEPVESPRDKAAKFLSNMNVGETVKVGTKSFDVWRHEPGSVTVLLTQTGTKGKKLYTIMPVDFDAQTFGVWLIDAVGERIGDPVVTGPAQITKKVGAFNVLQRRGLERQRNERDIQTVLENQRDGVLQDPNAKRIKDRTGLDPKKEKDRKELKKQINVSPPSGATAELERMIAEKLGWW